MSGGGDYYTMADGREDAAWMLPYREQIDALPIDDAIKGTVNQIVDEVYLAAIEHRSEEHAIEHKLLVLLLRGPGPAPVVEFVSDEGGRGAARSNPRRPRGTENPNDERTQQ